MCITNSMKFLDKQHYKLVIFDLDGTLFDTSKGILNSIDYAVGILKLQKPTIEQKYRFIGPPVFESFKNILELDSKQAKEATMLYRQYYGEHGIWESQMYDGLLNVIQSLKDRKIELGIATLKGEKFATKIVEHAGISKYFSAIFGQDENDSRNKADTISLNLNKTGMLANDAVMIGDSMHDYNGAESLCVDFCAVTYGFGFNKETAKGKYVANTPNEIESCICNGKI